MNLMQLLRILWARRGLVIGVPLAALAVAIIAHLVMPATYIASTSLVIDTKAVDPLTGINGPSQSLAAHLATQIDVITSRAVALKVVDELQLTQTAGEETRTRESWAYGLLTNLTVKPAANSNVVRISFEDADAAFAAAAANAFAAAYLQKSLDLKLDPARQQSAWFDEQLQQIRGSVESERQNLSEFQSKSGILAVDERLDVENARLEGISAQLVAAQRDAQEAQARLRQANDSLQNDQLAESPDIMGSGLLQSMKGDLVRAEARLAELSARLDRNHPQYISANAELSSLKEKMQAEIQRTKGALGQSLQIAEQQVANLQKAFDKQKLDILQLKRQRDELAVRTREVENAQGTYDQALQRASTLRLESQLDQTSVAVLDAATVPSAPAGLRLLLKIVLALVFGSMLGAAIAVALEMFDRRVRGSDELSLLSGIEVLAEIPHLRGTFKSGKPRLLQRPKNLLEIEPA